MTKVRLVSEESLADVQASISNLLPAEFSGTAKTIADSDANAGTLYTSDDTVTVTLPASGVAVGHVSVHVRRGGGDVVFVAAPGAVIEPYPEHADRIEGVGATATLWQSAAGVWHLSGQII